MYATGAPVIKMKAKAKRPTMKAPAPAQSTDKGNARKGKPVGSRLAFDATKQEAMKKKTISPAMEKRLQAHKVKGKHTAKHITKMRKLLREGKTFAQAHKGAM
tara:strand:- start:37 stop:345 length:309 start_codon:yes stop_codon:yes gene_type:complete